MNAHRVYSEKLDINTQNTMKFYNDRAQRAASMDCPYTAVLLGDQNPAHAEQWNIFEKEHILPELELNENSRVLEIGCGMGRWAETVIPMVKCYRGADFSSGMIETAKSRCVFKGRDYDFINVSFQQAVSEPGLFGDIKFDRVIIGGVCMYINDSDMDMCISGLNRLLADKCKMFLTETVAMETRLTLNECPSEALKTTYDVIYRTPAEYNEYYSSLIDNGFKIKKQDYLPHLNNEAGFSETDRWYTIFER
ncbi:MAG: class I SAM-dependent methyltransferase [Huintestinicola sp.]|uniref:class I SAM-dependent methyltransferase n=1 Tax=Huintestinicola sp. TaxID=2981661 RepID=UPI003F10D54B